VIQAELGIPGSTLSHHLEKLKNVDLVRVERRGTVLRYATNPEALQQVLHSLYAECCTRTGSTPE
jgi:DNA-binding transcriptional ArsR family regulator